MSPRLTPLQREALELSRERERIAQALADPARALRNLRARMATRRRQLADPNHDHVRYYPAYQPGMTTWEYVRTYQALNSRTPSRLQFVPGPAGGPT